jgi:hypothetical protein
VKYADGLDQKSETKRGNYFTEQSEAKYDGLNKRSDVEHADFTEPPDANDDDVNKRPDAGCENDLTKR